MSLKASDITEHAKLCCDLPADIEGLLLYVFRM